MASHDDKEIEAIKQRKMIELQNIAATKLSMSNIRKPIILTDLNFKREVSKYPIVLIDFWAPWCGPCRIVSPIIKQLASEYAGTVVFGNLNIDENQMVATSFGIKSIPTMMILKDGRVVDVLVGALPKGQIQMKIKQHLTGSTNGVSNTYG
jgi:thioredoxin 1